MHGGPVSGNASHTHGRTTMRFRSLEEQKKLASRFRWAIQRAGRESARRTHSTWLVCESARRIRRVAVAATAEAKMTKAVLLENYDLAQLPSLSR